ncbi:MAG: serine/threonine-protein kinase, partial [Bacteroidota bacterium]
MTPADWSRLNDALDGALDLPPEARVAFLDAQDLSPELRARAEAMLAADATEASLLDDPGRMGSLMEAAGADAERVPPGTEIGPYRVVREIGRGGMGTVVLAERADGAFEKRVALKLVRPGVAPGLLARFRAERRILARLEHPGIARLLDGGRTDDGRPYLAMEYVEGEPITDYADRQRLSIEQRLALFEQVCDAVAYAHRQLVVHRDLKPSNILVEGGIGDGRGMRDAAGRPSGAPEPPEASGAGNEQRSEDDPPHPSSSRIPHPSSPRVKLLDFGIAKLLDDGAEHSIVETAPEQRLLTPAYAAPEQVRGEAPSTATDVY